MTDHNKRALEPLEIELTVLAREIEVLLHLASPAAQCEWNAMRFLFPVPGEARSGRRSERNEVLMLLGKVQRFKDILNDALQGSCDTGTAPVLGGDGVAA